MRREAAVPRSSLFPLLPSVRMVEFAVVVLSPGDVRANRLKDEPETIESGRSGLADIRPGGVRAMGEGGPDFPVEVNPDRSETDLVIGGGRKAEFGRRRGAAERVVGMRRVEVLACTSLAVVGREGVAVGKMFLFGETGGLEVGGGIASIAIRIAGSVLLPRTLFGLSNAARSGSREPMLKLVSGLSGVRSRPMPLSEGTSSTTTPFNQSCFPPLSDSAARTSLLSFDVERSNGEVSFDGDGLPCRVLRGGG